MRLQLGAGGPDDEGVAGWALRGIERGGSIDGLRTIPSGAPRRDAAPAQPNGVLGVDHVVAATPDFARTTAALAAAGLELRRVREAGTAQQGFYVVGDALLEVVGPLVPDGDGPARFWGITFVVADLDATCAELGPERVRAPRTAVQEGRRIATLRRAAGLGTAVALMGPRQRE